MSKPLISVTLMLVLVAVGAWTNIATAIFSDAWWTRDWRVMGPAGALLLIAAVALTAREISRESHSNQPPHSSGGRLIVNSKFGANSTVNMGDVTHNSIQYSRPPHNLVSAIGASEYLERAVRLSDDRRMRRLLATGMDARLYSRVRQLIDLAETVVPLPTGTQSVVVLSGQLGSGKSEAADRAFRSAIRAAQSSTDQPLPVWVSAQELVNGATLEGRVADELGLTAISERGAFVVLDGLDERYHEIATMLTQATGLVAAWPKSRVLVTTRPTLLTDRGFAVINIPLLATDDALNLIQDIAQPGEHFDRGWSNDLRELIQRPLFALIAAQHLDALGSARVGPAQLIDLVMTESAEREGAAFSSALRIIAVATTAAGHGVDIRTLLSPEQLGAVQGSPFLTVNNHVARFTLAVFQQWLAAQALISDDVQVANVVAQNMASFDRWRYAVSIAAATADANRFDAIMTSLARWRPATASWVLEEVEHSDFYNPNRDSVSEIEATATPRAQDAMRAWLHGLGPAADVLGLENREFHATGPSFLDRNFLTAEYDTRTARVHLTVESRERTLTLMRQTNRVGWPWEVTLEVIAGEFKRNLQSYIIENPPPGVVETEVYRHILRSAPPDTLPTDEQLERGLARLEANDLPDGYDAANRDEHMQQMRLLMSGKAAAQSDRYRWTGPDIANPAPWSEVGGYSTAQLELRVNEITAAALDAYQSIVDYLFPTFRETLHTRLLMPVTMQGHVSVHRNSWGPGNHDIWLTYWLKPGTDHNKAEVSSDAGDSPVSFGDGDDALYQQFTVWLESHPEARPFARYVRSSGATDFFSNTPATALAFSWLWDDLKETGFVKDHRPRSFL